jgi:hypothetical protein
LQRFTLPKQSGAIVTITNISSENLIQYTLTARSEDWLRPRHHRQGLFNRGSIGWILRNFLWVYMHGQVREAECMGKWLQVFLKENEYREIQRAARSRNMSVAELVRHAINLVRRNEPSGSVETKLEAIRAAALLEYPTADTDAMLAEIECGYSPETRP